MNTLSLSKGLKGKQSTSCPVSPLFSFCRLFQITDWLVQEKEMSRKEYDLVTWLFMLLRTPLLSFSVENNLVQTKGWPVKAVSIVLTQSKTQYVSLLFWVWLHCEHTRILCSQSITYEWEGQGMTINIHMSWISSTMVHIPFSYWTSFTKYKYKDKIMKNFKMVMAEP